MKNKQKHKKLWRYISDLLEDNISASNAMIDARRRLEALELDRTLPEDILLASIEITALRKRIDTLETAEHTHAIACSGKVEIGASITLDTREPTHQAEFCSEPE